MVPEKSTVFKSDFRQLCANHLPSAMKATGKRDGVRRLIPGQEVFLAMTERQPIFCTELTSPNASILEKAILEVTAGSSADRADLHDGLGQHLTGIAFMSKVQEQSSWKKACRGHDAANCETG